jgi:hypothetical protein
MEKLFTYIFGQFFTETDAVERLITTKCDAKYRDHLMNVYKCVGAFEDYWSVEKTSRAFERLSQFAMYFGDLVDVLAASKQLDNAFINLFIGNMNSKRLEQTFCIIDGDEDQRKLLELRRTALKSWEIICGAFDYQKYREEHPDLCRVVDNTNPFSIFD